MKFKLKENRKEIITDTLTPVSIYLKIRDIYANSILLESSDYSSKDNSYAYICFKPIAKFELEKLIGDDDKYCKNFLVPKERNKKGFIFFSIMKDIVFKFI